MENLALGFLQNCQEVDTERFSGFFYLSLSYILGEILLLIGIDVIGRKIFLSKCIVNMSLILISWNYSEQIFSVFTFSAFRINGNSSVPWFIIYSPWHSTSHSFINHTSSLHNWLHNNPDNFTGKLFYRRKVNYETVSVRLTLYFLIVNTYIYIIVHNYFLSQCYDLNESL